MTTSPQSPEEEWIQEQPDDVTPFYYAFDDATTCHAFFSIESGQLNHGGDEDAR